MRNPTCDLRAYTGGLLTCHHKWVLLDAEQQQPWTDQPLVYYKKFRVYYQEYNTTAPQHQNLQRHDWGIGADGDHSEYDVIQCPAGTPADKCTQTITGTWMPVGAVRDKFALRFAVSLRSIFPSAVSLLLAPCSLLLAPCSLRLAPCALRLAGAPPPFLLFHFLCLRSTFSCLVSFLFRFFLLFLASRFSRLPSRLSPLAFRFVPRRTFPFHHLSTLFHIALLLF
jgi:hypothetical protein